MIYLILSAGFKEENPDILEKRLKIGYAKDIKERLDTYYVTNPDVILLDTREGDTKLEHYLHKKFEKYKYPKRNEWFYFDEEIIKHFHDEPEEIIDKDILLECIKTELISKIPSISELKDKYLDQILNEIKSRDDFNEELYDEEAFIKVIVRVWERGIKQFNDSINNIEFINNSPINLFNCPNDIEVTIKADLPQILGRQRLEENPWKNRAELYIKFLSEGNKITAEDFKKRQKVKIEKTKSLLRSYDVVLNEDKHNLAETYQYVAKSKNYKDDYVAVNTHDGKDLVPVFNNLVMVSEFRSFEIQQIDYPDRFRIINNLSSSGKYEFDPVMNEVDCFLSKFNSVSFFTDKMKLLCESKLSDRILNLVLKQIPLEYSTYYSALGPGRIKTYGYQRSKLINEYESSKNKEKTVGILNKIILSNFKIGDRLTLSEIKSNLKELFRDELDLSPKAKILEEFFEVKKTKVKNSEGKFVDGYELLKLKE